MKADKPKRSGLTGWRRGLLILACYLAVWLLASYIFYRRFPANYRQPNFYAEDGKVFARSIINHGFWQSLMTTFNGYYIWGLYILEKIGFIINDWFYGGQFANLPRAFALVSYGYLGLMASLPIFLFRRYFKLVGLVLIAILVAYVPLRGSDYAIIGTIGNLKFTALYVAFLLLCYRHLLPEKSKKIYLVDLGLLLCAYTDITVYVMMPFALLRYRSKFNYHDYRKAWPSLKRLILNSRSFQSLVILGATLLPQLYIVKRDGVKPIPGYLTNGFNFHRTVEIFVSRSYLYDVLFPFNKHLNDTIVVVLFLVFVGVALRFARRYRQFLIFGLLTILAGSFLFVVKRTGVSDFFTGYRDGGPDQFFYPQNWIFSFIAVLAFVEIVSRFKLTSTRFIMYFLAFAAAIFIIAPNASDYGLNNFMAQTVGNVYSVGQKDCDQKAQRFNLIIYPTKDWIYPGVSRQQLCTSAVVNYQPQDVSVGLTPYNNNYKPVANVSFTQTFKSTYNNLDGLNVYFSTFMRRVGSPYTLKLLDAACKNQLYAVGIHTGSITDNSFSTVLFPTIKDSLGKSYCFSITPKRVPADPLAIQLSAPGAYKDGRATINGKPINEDVVFGLHYK